MSEPVRPARSSAPRMATPPSSAAETEASAPLKRPIGVLDPATMTDDMEGPPQVPGAWWAQLGPRDAQDIVADDRPNAAMSLCRKANAPRGGKVNGSSLSRLALPSANRLRVQSDRR